jgi:hypothetical protein
MPILIASHKIEGLEDMAQHDELSELGKALAELDEARVETLVRQSLGQAIAPEEITCQRLVWVF